MIQLDLFEGDQFVLLMQEFQKVKDSSEKVRRGIFARIGEMEQKIREMQSIKTKQKDDEPRSL